MTMFALTSLSLQLDDGFFPNYFFQRKRLQFKNFGKL